MQNSTDDIYKKSHEIVKIKAMNSRYIAILLNELIKEEPISEEELADIVMRELNRDWLPDSAVRYLNAGRSWMKYFGYLDKIRGQQSFFDYGWDDSE